MLDLFVTGPVAVTDWFARTRPGLPILMTGFSGGGFVTTLATAVDPRAPGPSPSRVLRTNPASVNCKDDYEQCLPELLDVITMPDLYLLSAYSRDPVERKAGQVLNAGDPCCHQGVPTPEWEQQVNEALMTFTDDRFSYRLGRNAARPPHPGGCKPSPCGVRQRSQRTTVDVSCARRPGANGCETRYRHVRLPRLLSAPNLEHHRLAGHGAYSGAGWRDCRDPEG